ncbi:hypothetical protein [Caballeronia sp. dw_19]|uniref:GntT/GntP/DsdX family permease n=1 Tax=Caballeronia sp. dw_19 TaxID=2719791 RepID=UPI003211A198
MIQAASYWNLEYVGMTVTQTFKTWTVCETIISVFTPGLSMVPCCGSYGTTSPGLRY